MIEIARGYLGNTSNNIAEYEGIRACLLRALEVSRVGDFVLFEMDSLLVARQLLVVGIGKFACRSTSLSGTLLDCIILGRRLDSLGVSWRIRHVYREYNQTADALANQAIDLGSLEWSPPPP